MTWEEQLAQAGYVLSGDHAQRELPTRPPATRHTAAPQ